MKKEILIIDIETTGFLQAGGKIVEIGIVSLDLNTGNKEIIFDSVVHETGITRDEVQNSWIVSNSTLTVDMVRNSPNLNKVRSEIQNIINSYPNGATAYNNAFDFGFLENRGFTFPVKLDCPMKISTDICKLPNARGGYKWPKVEEAHKYFFGEVGYIESHRGADDAFHECDIVYELYKLGKFTI